jgi:nitroreductase
MKDFFQQLVKNRYSVRSYKPDLVDIGLVEKCLEAARLAPSACNSQPWKFIAVDDPELKNKLAAETSDRALPLNHFTRQAPVMIAIIAEKGNITSRLGQVLKDRDFPWLDVGIAAAHFCLQATELGLGTCMIGWFHEKKIKELLGIPSSKRVALLITLGYPATEIIPSKKRKSLQEIVSFNTYRNQDIHLKEKKGT